MRILKFNESEEIVNISPERVTEIINEISPMISDIDGKAKVLNGLLSELENFKSGSKKNNNQIDDAIINLDSIKSKLDETTSLLDRVIETLNDYNENGSKFLY